MQLLGEDRLGAWNMVAFCSENAGPQTQRTFLTTTGQNEKQHAVLLAPINT